MQENHTDFPTAAGQSKVWIAEVNEDTEKIRMKRITGKLTDELSIRALTYVHDKVHSGEIGLSPHAIDGLEIDGKKETWRWGNYITGLLRYLGCNPIIGKQANPAS
jgi:hypothetical protein